MTTGQGKYMYSSRPDFLGLSGGEGQIVTTRHTCRVFPHFVLWVLRTRYMRTFMCRVLVSCCGGLVWLHLSSPESRVVRPVTIRHDPSRFIRGTNNYKWRSSFTCVWDLTTWLPVDGSTSVSDDPTQFVCIGHEWRDSLICFADRGGWV